MDSDILVQILEFNAFSRAMLCKKTALYNIMGWKLISHCLPFHILTHMIYLVIPE